jgi:H+/Cl- antiporter ClcA/CBS domain-containing protein
MLRRLQTWWQAFRAGADGDTLVCPNCHQRGPQGRCRWCGFDAADPEVVAKVRAEQAQQRARRRAFWGRIYLTLNNLFHINVGDFYAVLVLLIKWTLLGGAVGVLAGTASAVFLISLTWATNTRLDHPALIFLLPIGGFTVGWIYYRFAGVVSQGNNLVIEEVNANKARIPFRMAPLVLFGTVVTHLFGGSAGREGTAIQMGASLADSLRRILRLSPDDRRLMIMAGISGGFGSVFGTPVAGFVFGMEVQSVGRIRYDGIIPCLVAAYVGDIITRMWGVTHSHYPRLAAIEMEPLLLLQVAAAGIVFGLTSIVFVELTHGIKHLQTSLVNYPPLRPMVGGFVIIGLALSLGTHDYLGLSLPLIEKSISGESVATFAFLLKLIFTAITLGSGFLGGEVTPLFVIGSTLGYTLGLLLGVNPVFMASIGFVAVFAGASNTPLACSLMGMELFGGGSPLYLILGCVIAYLASGHRGIYSSQIVGSPKFSGADVLSDESLKANQERRGGGWLPPLPQIDGQLARRPVRALMSPRAVSVREDTPMHALIALALREGVRTLPVLNAQKVVVGIVTDNDVRRAGLNVNLTRLKQMTPEEQSAALQDVRDLPANALMSKPPVTISHLASVAEAVDVLIGENLKRLPVTDESGHLMGMLTRSDILRELVFAQVPTSNGSDTLFNFDACVEDVELEPAITISLNATLREAINEMTAQEQKRLIVVDVSQKAVGLLTESDLLNRVSNGERARVLDLLNGQAAEEAAVFAEPVQRFMTAPLMTVRAETPAATALRLMIDNQIKRLPVIGPDGRVLGLVGRAGLMRVLFGAHNAAVAKGR